LLGDKGGVNSAIVMACAESVVTNHDINLLTIIGGYIIIVKDWDKVLLNRMGFVNCTSTLAKVSL